MKREIVELREAQKREIAALRGEFTERDNDLREKLAIVEEAHEALRQQLAESNGAQQRANPDLKQQLGSAEDIASVQREPEKSGGGTAKQPPSPAPKAPATAPLKPAAQTAGKKKFPFTWDMQNEQGERKMPAGGLIAHLTAKGGGNVHEKGVVEITASSVASTSSGYAPRKAANLKTCSHFYSKNHPGGWICWDFKILGIEPTTTRSGRSMGSEITVA
jgi:hypothetical protein